MSLAVRVLGIVIAVIVLPVVSILLTVLMVLCALANICVDGLKSRALVQHLWRDHQIPVTHVSHGDCGGYGYPLLFTRTCRNWVVSATRLRGPARQFDLGGRPSTKLFDQYYGIFAIGALRVVTGRNGIPLETAGEVKPKGFVVRPADLQQSVFYTGPNVLEEMIQQHPAKAAAPRTPPYTKVQNMGYLTFHLADGISGNATVLLQNPALAATINQNMEGNVGPGGLETSSFDLNHPADVIVSHRIQLRLDCGSQSSEPVAQTSFSQLEITSRISLRTSSFVRPSLFRVVKEWSPPSTM